VTPLPNEEARIVFFSHFSRIFFSTLARTISVRSGADSKISSFFSYQPIHLSWNVRRDVWKRTLLPSSPPMFFQPCGLDRLIFQVRSHVTLFRFFLPLETLLSFVWLGLAFSWPDLDTNALHSRRKTGVYALLAPVLDLRKSPGREEEHAPTSTCLLFISLTHSLL